MLRIPINDEIERRGALLFRSFHPSATVGVDATGAVGGTVAAAAATAIGVDGVVVDDIVVGAVVDVGGGETGVMRTGLNSPVGAAAVVRVDAVVAATAMVEVDVADDVVAASAAADFGRIRTGLKPDVCATKGVKPTNDERNDHKGGGGGGPRQRETRVDYGVVDSGWSDDVRDNRSRRCDRRR